MARGGPASGGQRPALVRLAASLLLAGVARAQVRNVRFEDTDAGANTIGGWVYWDHPLVPGATDRYSVFLAEDAAGTGEVQTGPDVAFGRMTSKLEIPAGTAISSSITHILVYMKDGAGSLSNSAATCLLDNPGGVSRTFYLTTTGHTKASSAKAALVSACYAQEYFVTVEMVATVKSTGTYVEDIVETTFDNADEQSDTASWQLIFDSGATLSEIDTALAAVTPNPVGDAPVQMAHTGASSSSGYKLAYVKSLSSIGRFHAEARPDLDIARYLARSSVAYSIAYAATVNRKGEVRLQTKSTQASSAISAIQEMADVYFGAGVQTVAFSDLGAAHLSDIDGRATESQAQCWQVSSDPSHGSCTNPSL